MLSGGKLIGEGSYGCIFTPSLECKNKKTQQKVDENPDLEVSKLILTKYAKQEDDVSTLIRKIPLWKNYFIVSETICQPSSNQKDKQLKDCSVIQDQQLSKFRLLFMSYGGKPLNIHRFTLTNFDFLEFTKHLISAGALLNLFGVVHRDIHNGNILVDSSNIPRIIDFNLAIFVEHKSSELQLSHQYDFQLSQEPPDSTLVNAIHIGYQANSVMSSIIYKKQIIKKISHLLDIPLDDLYNELDEFYKQSKSIQNGNDTKWFDTYWRTIDSWAIGVNIVQLYYKLSLWTEFSSYMDRIKPKLIPIIKGLCSISPLKRMDCVQALYSLDPNHFIIRKYASTWLNKVGFAP